MNNDFCFISFHLVKTHKGTGPIPSGDSEFPELNIDKSEKLSEYALHKRAKSVTKVQEIFYAIIIKL